MTIVRRPAESICFFSVVRYVPDPVRDEAKNIGVVLVAPDAGFAGARFNLAKTHLPRGSEKLEFLRSIAKTYQKLLPGGMPTSRELVERSYLESLHSEATNQVQFTAPNVGMGKPSEVLDRIYRERVAESMGGGGPAWSNADTIR